MNSNTNTKNCDHKYECGCDKQYCAVCVEQHIEEAMDDDEKKRNSYLCEDESCRHYYAHRNDNCDCDGRDCGFCNPIVCGSCGNNLEECGRCFDCDIVHNICGCCRCDLTDDTGGNTMDDDEIWCDECYENETDECEECGELFRLGTFNTVEMEDDGTQFCFCDGCRDKMIADCRIKATDEETIYSITPCECCDVVGRDNKKCDNDNYIYCEECMVNFIEEKVKVEAPIPKRAVQKAEAEHPCSKCGVVDKWWSEKETWKGYEFFCYECYISLCDCAHRTRLNGLYQCPRPPPIVCEQCKDIWTEEALKLPHRGWWE